MKEILSQTFGLRTAAPLLLLGLSLAGLTACESITGVAPKNTPRVEIELAVVIDDAFSEPLVGVNSNSPLYPAVRQAVRDKADLGLRFYPTPSESYGADDERPEYLMKVRVERLSFKFDHKQVAEDDEPSRIESRVEQVRASVTVTIDRRRANGPALSIATARTTSDVSAESKKERIDAGDGYVLKLDGETVKVLEKDLLRAVRSAVDKALKSMRTPIDREFAGTPTRNAEPASAPPESSPE